VTLIDTSAWIDFFKGKEPMAGAVERHLDDNKVALCGPVYTELLRGLRSKKDRSQVLPLLSGCRFLPQPERLWEDAGNCGFILRRQGKTIKSMDLLIACYAMAHSVPILTSDTDFSLISKAGFDLTIESPA
jgi:tRNA(fMet)-specific endonuclease VapC